MAIAALIEMFSLKLRQIRLSGNKKKEASHRGWTWSCCCDAGFYCQPIDGDASFGVTVSLRESSKVELAKEKYGPCRLKLQSLVAFTGGVVWWVGNREVKSQMRRDLTDAQSDNALVQFQLCSLSN